MWKAPQKRKDRTSEMFLSRRGTPLNDSPKPKLDPNIISAFMTDELDYQFSLADLSVILGGVKSKKQNEITKSDGVSSSVIVCLSSSIAMMHTLSKDIIELLVKMLKLFPSHEDPLLQEKEHSDSDSSENDIQDETEDFIDVCENIVNLLLVYEAFCCNENGVCHKDLLQLFVNQPQKKSRPFSTLGKLGGDQGQSVPFNELILYPFLAVDRYQAIFCHLATVISSIYPLVEEIRNIQELIRPSKERILKRTKVVTKLSQIKGLPSSFSILKSKREFLKSSPVKKQRAARPNAKERIFYLCNDVLIYCTSSQNFKGMFYCSALRLRDMPDHPTQFQITFIRDKSIKQFEERVRYTITAESTVEKQDWLQKFHIALSSHGTVDSPKISRRLRLTTLEETALKDIPASSFQGSILPRELKDLSECLNSTTVWNSETRPALDVSIDLLQMIMNIFTENRGLLERFGVSGFGLISIHPSFHEFENASAELQRVDISDLCNEEKIIFWINIYNTISLHSHVKQACQIKHGLVAFQTNNKYYIGGHIFSLSLIEHGILRANSHSPSFLLSSKIYPKLKKTDPRNEFVLEESNPLINFALNIGATFSPPVVLYTPETWYEQLLQQARTYCRHHIRIFLHTNQRKVFLPKTLNLYWKDFGSSQREMLIYIRDRFLHPSQQQELAFLDNPSEPVSIKFENPDWEFKYPIGKEEASEEISPTNTIVKEYVLLINQKHVYVTDTLSESPYTFSVPYQFLQLWIGPRRDQLKHFSKTRGSNSLLHQCFDRQKNHLEMMNDSLKIYSRYVTHSGDYHGLTFRPSTFKTDPMLQFVALNLQTQLTKVARDKAGENLISTYSHVTFGAPVAHLYRFKNGLGLRQLMKARNRLLPSKVPHDFSPEQETELTDMEAQIQMRLDVCVPQIISAVITGIARFIELRPSKETFQQILHCGFLLQFESLLSTHGSEIGMIGDLDVACQMVEHFRIQFVEESKAFVSMNPKISVVNDYSEEDFGEKNNLFGDYLITWQVPYFEELPDGIKQGELIQLKPVLVTQGINEKQTVAIRLGETKLQERINQENFAKLSDYYNSWASFQKFCERDINLGEYASQLQKIGEIIEISRCEKNVQILPRTADFVRSLGGLRFTSCKSAKDRTSMSITWEQGRFLHATAGLPESSILKVANDMRSRGVRRENAFRNIGKQKFKFNSLQKSSLPKEYQMRKAE